MNTESLDQVYKKHCVLKQYEYHNDNQWLVCVWVSELVAVMFSFCFGCLQNTVPLVYIYAKSVLQHLGW